MYQSISKLSLQNSLRKSQDITHTNFSTVVFSICKSAIAHRFVTEMKNIKMFHQSTRCVIFSRKKRIS